MSQTVKIRLSQLVESQSQPRKHYSEQEIKELAEAIGQVGLLQAITVRKVGKNYEVVLGWRRSMAANVLGWKTIEAVVVEATDQEVAIMQIVENNQREAVNPMDEAVSFKTMLGDGMKVKDLAHQIGRSTKFVNHRLLLNSLLPAVQDIVYQGIMPDYYAAKIAVLQPVKQTEVLKYVLITDSSSKPLAIRPISDLDYWIKNNILLELKRAPFPLDTELGGHIACQKCPKRSSKTDELFADIKSDHCMHPGCWADKVEAVVLAGEEKARKQHPARKLRRVANRWHTPTKDVLSLHFYELRNSKNACAHCAVAVISESDNPAEIGKVVFAHLKNGRCNEQPAADKKAGNQSVGKQKDREHELHKIMVDMAGNDLMAKCKPSEIPVRPMLRIAAHKIWQDVTSVEQQIIAYKLKWNIQGNDQVESVGADEMFEWNTSSYTEKQIQELICICLIPELVHDAKHMGKLEEFEIVAKACGVDMKRGREVAERIYSIREDPKRNGSVAENVHELMTALNTEQMAELAKHTKVGGKTFDEQAQKIYEYYTTQ